MNSNTKNLVIGIVVLLVVIGAWMIFASPKSAVAPAPTGSTATTTVATSTSSGQTTNQATSTQPKSAQVSVRLGKTISALGITITPHAVTEDSRCPVGVQCIQAGTVRVRAALTSSLGTGEPVFTLNQPITTEAETITLIEVGPTKMANSTIKDADYIFVFKIVKR